MSDGLWTPKAERWSVTYKTGETVTLKGRLIIHRPVAQIGQLFVPWRRISQMEKVVEDDE